MIKLMFRRSILVISLIVASVHAAQERPAASAFVDFRKKVYAGDFTAISVDFDNARNDQALSNEMFKEFCAYFKNSLSVERFEQAYSCLTYVLSLGIRHPKMLFFALDHMQELGGIDALYDSQSSAHEPICIFDPIMFSIYEDSPMRTEVIDQTCRLITLMVQAGADPNEGNFNEIASPLLYASLYDAPELVTCLLKHGAQANDLTAVYFAEYEEDTLDDEFYAYYAAKGIDLSKINNTYSLTGYYLKDVLIKEVIPAKEAHYRKRVSKLEKLISTNTFKEHSYYGSFSLQELQEEIDELKRALRGFEIKRRRCEDMLNILKKHGAQLSVPNKVHVGPFMTYQEDLTLD